MVFSQEKRLAYIQLMRLDKPIGAFLLLWPTLWALFLASRGLPDLSVLLIFIAGVFLMRSAGCVINDYADKEIDGRVKRTSQRPLATGQATPAEAKWLFFALLASSFILVLFLNGFTIALSFVGGFLAVIYPFMKRYTNLPQFVLGAAFGWAIPMAYGAVLAELPLECWLLFLANLAWTVAYDTQYAMVDRDDDIRIGVKSTAILFAEYDNKIIALLQIIALVFLVWVGCLTALHYSYFLLLGCAAVGFIYQRKLTQQRDRQQCFRAFLSNNYVGFIIFIAVLFGLQG